MDENVTVGSARFLDDAFTTRPRTRASFQETSSTTQMVDDNKHLEMTFVGT